MATTFKVSFTLDEKDASYFRGLFRKAKKQAGDLEATEVIAAARSLIDRVRAEKRTPNFVRDAITTLEDSTQLIEDEDYAAPKGVVSQVLAGLAYFANPDDLIPDHVPGLGFLDDAIMIKFVEDEFKHELWAYRRFVKFRKGAEQRPWSNVVRERFPSRLRAERQKLRESIEARKQKDAKRNGGF